MILIVYTEVDVCFTVILSTCVHHAIFVYILLEIIESLFGFIIIYRFTSGYATLAVVYHVNRLDIYGIPVVVYPSETLRTLHFTA